MNTLLSPAMPALVTLSTSEDHGITFPTSVPSGYARQAQLEAIAKFSAFKGI